jgi:hypothetical protein
MQQGGVVVEALGDVEGHFEVGHVDGDHSATEDQDLDIRLGDLPVEQELEALCKKDFVDCSQLEDLVLVDPVEDHYSRLDVGKEHHENCFVRREFQPYHHEEHHHHHAETAEGIRTVSAVGHNSVVEVQEGEVEEEGSCTAGLTFFDLFGQPDATDTTSTEGES